MTLMTKYLGHNGEWVSDGDCDDYDLYPHLKSDLGGGPCDELDRAEEMRERGRRVVAGLRNDQQRRDEMIKIGHLNKADVLAALFNNARTQGMGVLHYKPEHVMDREEAQGLLGRSEYFDYLEGRVMKVDLGKEELDPWLYDRDNGEGAAKLVISGVKEQS